MKRLSIILTVVCVFLSFTTNAQKINLTKLPKAQRDSAAIQIAIAAMKKYAPSYYDESIMPTVEYVTYDTSDKRQYPPSLVVDFFFDYKKAIEEGREGENVYGGKVYIWAETGEPLGMLPTGWERALVINQTKTRSGDGQQEIAPPTTVPRDQFKRWR